MLYIIRNFAGSRKFERESLMQYRRKDVLCQMYLEGRYRDQSSSHIINVLETIRIRKKKNVWGRTQNDCKTLQRAA